MIEKMTWWPLCKSEFSDNDDDFLEMTCLFWSPHYCRLQQKTCNNKLQQNWRFLKLFFLLKMGCFCSNCHEVLGAILTGREHYLANSGWSQRLVVECPSPVARQVLMNQLKEAQAELWPQGGRAKFREVGQPESLDYECWFQLNFNSNCFMRGYLENW